MAERKRILLMCDWFDPAYKAGGPIRSAVNFVHHMNDEYDLLVYTGNTDLDQTDILKGIESNRWTDYAKNVSVFYADKTQQGFGAIRRMIQTVHPDFVYLNSVFSTSFTIYPLTLKFRRLTGSAKIILSPRGMLRPSALKFKATKKRIFLRTLNFFRISQKIRFIATDQSEAIDIKQAFGNCDIQVASNFGATIIPFQTPISKSSGTLSIMFIGRVHPIKNLDFLLRVLQTVKGKLKLTIVGVLEDSSYWDACKEIIALFPKDIVVDFKADLPHYELGNLIANHHIFALPTQGENYGHAIFEALSHGKPVVISDQTPWRNLESIKAGWDLPLNDPDNFRNALQTTVDWDQQEYNEWSMAARKKAEKEANHAELKKTYKKIFS